MRFNQKLYIFLLIAFFLSNHAVLCAQKKVIYQADILEYDEAFYPGIRRLIGNVIFQHENTKIYSDSAYFWESQQIIEAYGKEVQIVTEDSVFIFGKKLRYDGILKLAILTTNVRLIQKEATLYTDTLYYDLNIDKAYYNCGGKIIDQENTLISRKAYFYTRLNEAYFKDSVVLHNPEYDIYSDTLKFNTATQIAYIFGPTDIISKESTIFCKNGWYNTQNDNAYFSEDAVISSPPNLLYGDEIYYDRRNKTGKAFHNVIMSDTSQRLIAMGNYAEYDENRGYSFVTDSTLLIYYESGDSLFLHCDTVYAQRDSLKNIETIRAYHDVAFFRADIQGRCDSMVYIAKDSLLYLYKNPVLWADSNQITADTIYFFIPDNRDYIGYFKKDAFFISALFDETEFNQVKGKDMTAYFIDRILKHIDVNGNVESLYFLLEGDTAVIGINLSFANRVTVFLEDNQIQTIHYIDKPEGTIYPYSQLPENEKFFKGFNWRSEIRPLSKEDVFIRREVVNEKK